MNARKLSIVIPTLNESGRIGERIAQIRRLEDAEIVVVDGGSQDATREAALAADQVLETAPGRARQQNAGAVAASGEFLLFLHADCAFLEPVTDAIASALNDHRIIGGCFVQRIASDRFRYRIVERGNGLRVRTLGWAYGDQALFFRRQQFLDWGGFPDVVFLEDWLLVRSLKSRGKIKLVDHPILQVDPRRWEQRGVIRQTLRNWSLLLAACCGATPEQLVRFYPPVR